MIADARLDAGRFGPPADDTVGVLLKEGVGCKLAGLATGGPEEVSIDVIDDAGRLDVIVQILIETMMTGNVVLLTAPGVEPKNGSSTVLKVVFDLPIHDRAESGCILNKASKQKILELGRAGNPYAREARLVWSADSSRVAYIQPWHRGHDIAVYFRKGATFEPIALPKDMPSPALPNRRRRDGTPRITELNENDVKGWLKSGALVLSLAGENDDDEKDTIRRRGLRLYRSSRIPFGLQECICRWGNRPPRPSLQIQGRRQR